MGLLPVLSQAFTVVGKEYDEGIIQEMALA